MNIPAVFRKCQGDGGDIVRHMSFLIREPADVYHAQSGSFLTSHQLADFRRSALLRRRRRLPF